jgi:hypothetical protein
MAHTVKSIVLDLRGKTQPALHGRATMQDESGQETETQTPEEKLAVKD